MYNRIYFDKFKNLIHLWDDVKGYSKFEYSPYAYIAADDGDKLTMTGVKVKKTTTWNSTAEDIGIVFESDVQPEMRTLIDLYGDSDDIADNLIMYFDIEVRKNERYSTVEEASNEINAISFVTNKNEIYRILLLDEKSENKKYEKIVKVIGTDVEVDCEVEVYTSEIQLLKSFLNYLRDIDPSIITGWNTDFFDIPYLYNRVEKILGKEYSNLLSPINIVRRSNYMGKDEILIAGMYNLDYLNLYKKFTYSEEPTYRLDAIAKKELGIGKIEYEGSLDDLWRDDPEKFISYSVIDTWLVKQLDLKLDYIDIACGICHKGHVPYSDIAFTSKYLEGALLTHLFRQGLVAVRSEKTKNHDTAEGAYVKEPNPGLYRWIYDLDLTSLYPWNIISLNISPETKFGHIYQWDQKEFLQKAEKPWIILKKGSTISSAFFHDLEDDSNNNEIRFSNTVELQTYLKEANLSISSAGIIYSLDKVGLIPDVLRRWFAERTDYSNLMKEFGLSGDTEKERYYDKKQLVTKILLNSLYGVLLLPTFRFYDRQNGESVTKVGKTVIKWATAMADQFYKKELVEFNNNYEIEFEDGSTKTLHGFDLVTTNQGKKYVFMLLENDELL
jgi:DNA polymerase elongation subunit (family B)